MQKLQTNSAMFSHHEVVTVLAALAGFDPMKCTLMVQQDPATKAYLTTVSVLEPLNVVNSEE